MRRWWWWSRSASACSTGTCSARHWRPSGRSWAEAKPLLHVRQQFQRHHQPVLTAVAGGVIPRPAADFVESLVVVQRDRDGVARAYLQKDPLHATGAGDLQQHMQQRAAVAMALQLRGNADVEDVRLAGGDAEQEIADDAAILLDHP